MPPIEAGAREIRKLERSAQVLRTIEKYIWRHDRSPTVRELCDETRIPSTSYVFFLLAGLELDGHITREPGVSRSIRLTRPHGVLIKGTIAAGEPLDLFDPAELETLDLAVHTRSAGDSDGTRAQYAFRVRGDSMIEDGIFDGDYVLVRPTHAAPDGATVLAVHLVHEASPLGAITLKRLHVDRQRKRVCLCPANAALRPIEIPTTVWKREWAIHGTVTAVYRSYGH